MTTSEANTSTAESRPKASSASEPAAMPVDTATATSTTFHPTVAYSRRRPMRRASTSSSSRLTDAGVDPIAEAPYPGGREASPVDEGPFARGLRHPFGEGLLGEGADDGEGALAGQH